MPQYRKNSSGITPLVILVIVGLIAVIGYFVLKGGGGIKVPGTSNIPKVSERDFSFIKDENVRKHLTAQANVRKMRLKAYGDEKSARDPTVANYVEIDLIADNASTWFEQGGQKDLELVNVNGVVYVKDYSDNSWWMQTKPKEETEEFLLQREVALPSDLGEIPAGVESPDYEMLTQEPCPGTPSLTCFKYREPGPDPDPAFDRFFWFDTKDYLLRHEESGYGEFRGYSDYSYDNIEISVPSPTKPVPEGQMVEYYYVGRGGTPLTPENLQDYPVPEDYLQDLDY